MNEKIIRKMALFVGLFHALMGFLALLTKESFLFISKYVWGAVPNEVGGSFLFNSGLLAAYMCGFGVLLVFISKDIEKYRKLIFIPITVLFFEFVHTIRNISLIKESFYISQSALSINILVSVFLFMFFVWCYISLNKRNKN